MIRVSCMHTDPEWSMASRRSGSMDVIVGESTAVSKFVSADVIVAVCVAVCECSAVDISISAFVSVGVNESTSVTMNGRKMEL